MKTPVLCLIIGAAGAAGLGGGWLLWGGAKGEGEGESAVMRAIAGRQSEKSPGGTGAGTAGVGTDAAVGRHAAVVMADELVRIKTLTPREFALAMADVWVANPTPDNLLRRGLYLGTCNGERGAEFYLEYKRRKGMGPWDQSYLGEFFTTTASQDGRDFMERLLKANPGGFCELESVTHGWAVTDARGAVEWLNKLPDKTPFYDQALRGLMWGLAQNSPEYALQVYYSLDPAVRTGGVIGNMASSTVENHGIKGLAGFLDAIPDAGDRENFFKHAVGYAHREPPGEFVQEMAGRLTDAPYVQGPYNEIAARWAATDPDNALSWLVKRAEASGAGNAMDKLASSLATQPAKAEALRSWAAAHPEAPGRQAIENALAVGTAAVGP